MIEVNGQYITADVSEIISELKNVLEINGLPRFYKTIDTPQNYMVCCPFHKDGQERKPSMGIHKKTGVCHCFTCGWVGSIQELVSNCFGYDDLGIEGSKWLIRNFLTLQVEERKDIELDISRKNDNATILNANSNIDSTNNDVYNVNNTYISEQELDSYRYLHPYMYKRGLTDEIIDLFDIGYDKKTDCITFPIRDISGNTLFIARRSTKTKYFNYPEGVEKPLYGLYELGRVKAFEKYEVVKLDGTARGVNSLIVCESMLDALSFWVAGKCAVALNGLGNELQFKQLRELPCRELILATDNDEAGMRARKRIARNVTNKVLTQYIFPEGRKDANECTVEELQNLKKVFV